jgi:hypothetical protein
VFPFALVTDCGERDWIVLGLDMRFLGGKREKAGTGCLKTHKKCESEKQRQSINPAYAMLLSQSC